MSLLSNLKRAANIYDVGGSAQILISAGNADCNIETHSKNALIMTGNGNQNIAVDVSQDLAIDTGCQGNDYIIGNAGNAFINTHDSDDSVILDCDTLDLDVGDGNDNVLVSARGSFAINGENGDKVIVAETLNQVNNDNYITLGNGNNVINAMGNNIGIATGNGNQTIGTVGNNHSIVTGHGNQIIGFYGNNAKISLGDGYHDVRTMDMWLKAGEFNGNYDSASMGLFGHDIGLARTFVMNTLALDNNNNYCYAIRGVSNTYLEAGLGSLQGIVTIGDGDFTLKHASNSDGKVVNIATGELGSLFNFQEGVFRGQNGYILWENQQ